MSNTVEQVFEMATRGLSKVARFKTEGDRHIDISKDDRGGFHVTSVFPMGQRFEKSYDAQGVDADAAFKVVARLSGT